ncbi:MAG: Uma2 family endonuclease [Deltaproteobacteria bacterium]|nr:Uma2 family endonuclease [Deltaproteobacteria bacterium]
MAATLKSQPLILTYDDYLRFPNDGKRYEIFEGEVEMNPAPLVIHQRISRKLEFILLTYIEKNNLGEIFDAPVDVILSRTNVVQPDLVFVAKERSSIIAERGIFGAPDLVVEI